MSRSIGKQRRFLKMVLSKFRCTFSPPEQLQNTSFLAFHQNVDVKHFEKISLLNVLFFLKTLCQNRLKIQKYIPIDYYLKTSISMLFFLILFCLLLKLQLLVIQQKSWWEKMFFCVLENLVIKCDRKKLVSKRGRQSSDTKSKCTWTLMSTFWNLSFSNRLPKVEVKGIRICFSNF